MKASSEAHANTKASSSKQEVVGMSRPIIGTLETQPDVESFPHEAGGSNDVKPGWSKVVTVPKGSLPATQR